MISHPQDPATKKIRFDNVVTVVDSSAFVSTFISKDKIEDRPDLADGEGAGEDRAVVDLLVEQVSSSALFGQVWDDSTVGRGSGCAGVEQS